MPKRDNPWSDPAWSWPSDPPADPWEFSAAGQRFVYHNGKIAKQDEPEHVETA